MIWVKNIDSNQPWAVYSAVTGSTHYLGISNAAAASSSAYWNNTNPTSTQFTVNSSASVNANNNAHVAYLWGNVSGIIDIGSYTGTGSAGLQINCGFAAGARFVMIKRTDSTGDYYVFDTERGIVSGNDPVLYFNSTGPEPTASDLIDPYSPGFEVATTNADLNASGGSYLYMAIA